MKQKQGAYDLRAWRSRLHLTQAGASRVVGMSLNGYRAAEYRCDKAGEAEATLVLLCQAVETLRRVATQFSLLADYAMEAGRVDEATTWRNWVQLCAEQGDVDG